MKVAKQQVTLLDSMGSDLSVVNAARVSFDKASEWESEWWECGDGCCSEYREWLSEKDQKLIKYLAKHKHTSPFNHCFASFRVKAPIFVARQLVKHKFLVWNEVSRRYVDSEPEFWFPEAYRKKAENVKQGSSEETVTGSWVWASEQLLAPVVYHYQNMIDNGICAEQARMVLPQNTMTEWVWSGSLGAFADMCRLRLDSHSQRETTEVAQMIADEMTNLYPVAWKALMEN